MPDTFVWYAAMALRGVGVPTYEVAPLPVGYPLPDSHTFHHRERHVVEEWVSNENERIRRKRGIYAGAKEKPPSIGD